MFSVDTWGTSLHQSIAAGWSRQLHLGIVCCNLAHSSPYLIWMAVQQDQALSCTNYMGLLSSPMQPLQSSPKNIPTHNNKPPPTIDRKLLLDHQGYLTTLSSHVSWKHITSFPKDSSPHSQARSTYKPNQHNHKKPIIQDFKTREFDPLKHQHLFQHSQSLIMKPANTTIKTFIGVYLDTKHIVIPFRVQVQLGCLIWNIRTHF